MRLFLLFHDQLHIDLLLKNDFNPKNDYVLLFESWEHCTHIKHHKKKLLFQISALRQFHTELKAKKIKTHYIKLSKKVMTYTQAIQSLNLKVFTELCYTLPSEYYLLKESKAWKKFFPIIHTFENNLFYLSPTDFRHWAKNKKQLRLENLYRNLRSTHNILMHNNKPIGGQWNFDKDNRKKFNDEVNIPVPKKFKTNKAIISAAKDIDEFFPDHIGATTDFFFATTRKQALAVLNEFIKHKLKFFGQYQDAMINDEPFMFHSVISPYLNLSLITAQECIQKAEAAYHDKTAPINAVEGFIRQILGWREYVRGLYWLYMPGYTSLNYFNAKNDLPDFFWSGDTDMLCLKDSIKTTIHNAYAHHIQRLMILGNFSLLYGVDPEQINEWFHIVYADAYQWVELPNVSGMATFADGGIMASKPYAAR